MKKKYIIELLLAFNIVVVQAQEAMKSISLTQIVAKANSSDIIKTPDRDYNEYSEFNFADFKAGKAIHKHSDSFYRVYHSDDKITRIAQFDKKIEGLNYEYIVKDFERVRVIYVYKFTACDKGTKAIDHKCGEMVSGFFVHDKYEEDIYFFGTARTKEEQPEIELNDIYCIMPLNSDLKPIGKFRFYGGYLAYKSMYIFDRKLKERVYSYFFQDYTIPDEECMKYNKLEVLSLKRIKHLLQESYHCPVTLEATIRPEIPKEGKVFLPVWSLNGYSYE